MSSAFEGLPKTPNLKLNKPGYDNVADIEALNENADILDEEIQGIKNTFVKSVNGKEPDAGGNVNVEKYTHPNSGVTAGTYRSVTVNAQGHVTDGSNPTLAIANGGTGATTKADAQTNLGLNDAIVGLSVSGQTITYTQADGGTGTITTQDTVSVTPKRYITTTYISGTSWYEVYNDGWVRQGGLATAQNTTYTFLKPFKNTDFSFTTGLHHFFNSHNQGVTIKSMSATSFQLNMWYGEAGSGNGNTRWVAEGYGA